ncbi:hypothetical protein MGYG_06743 [Nannizzia gypsea CBS 118893]|uniref:Microbial-type PARG catalytic domain-containing protein n=1 Tax=Arthroderma gypseum (strain ATCC MYA-4604 / CBS 118893) TaxID=535722 RepID=E4V129_ARTGP|nr:hypothetical protein MGYG_06743 [Nannizzia gypsea CBS 118893]EFR03744.1 hypothetical protein MGYG_06743 [Nannizzia gypsea CBS 118893]
MVQTVLNFGSSRTQDKDTPQIIKKDPQSTTSPGDTLLPDSGMDYEMEDESSSKLDSQTSIASTDWPASQVGSEVTLGKPSPAQDAMQRRKILRCIAGETSTFLPGILEMAPWAPPNGYLYSPSKISQLNPMYCPRFHNTSIRVHNADSLDTAIALANCAKFVTVRDKKPVCVLNMANAFHAGGGWKNGALAQEETLCYRTSLSFTLKLRYYPLKDLQAIYSPTVLVIRRSIDDGHGLLSLNKPEKLPVVSVVSIAAICEPELATKKIPIPNSSDMHIKEVFKNVADRDLTKEKIRMALRTAAYNGHRRLVLGALGCGAFLNPREDVADCFAEVFSEVEFIGGWWESVIFAVMDDLDEGEDGDGNYGVFYRKLHGMMV